MQPLLASQISFRCLYGNVPEQEVNLVELSAGKMAQTRACPPQVMGREPLNTRTAAHFLHDLPQDSRRCPMP